jgi:predicted enzyme related to lactoylglutathione lyase
MNANENTLNWFEISVTDISRAKNFYETIFNIRMETSNMMGMDMAFFPMEMGNGKAGGCLCKSDQHKPSADGVKLYLNGNPDLSTALSKVEVSGGKIIMPKTKISDDIGYMASFVDTEGNTIAIHSQH